MIQAAPLWETAAGLRAHDPAPTEYVQEIESRVEAAEPEIHALVEEGGRWDRITSTVRAPEARYANRHERPPLYGVPVGVKDIFHVDGLDTKAGSDLPTEVLTGPEASVVTRLRDAGAVVLGKTVTTEFAYSEPGPTRNPHNLDHTPGGSSSGSAAAVAAGYCPVALGSQTVGSVIRPAAFCGVVGFKPSYGRIPKDGVIPLSTSVDHVGVFTQDVRGMQLAAAVVCPGWRALPTTVDLPTLGVPDGPYLDQASAEGRDRFDGFVELLEAAGFAVRHVPVLADIDAITETHYDVVEGEAALVHHEWFDAYGDRYRPETAELVENGRSVSMREIAAGRASRLAVREELTSVMADEGVDVWVSPPAPGPAPHGIDDTGDPAMNLPWTHTGLPTVTIPGSNVLGDLPFGVQCTAGFMGDEALLAWAESIEDALATE